MSEERKRNLRTQGRFSGSKNGANNISPGANSGASPTFCDVKSRLSLSPQSTCVNSENTPELVYKKSNWVPVQQELMECKTFQTPYQWVPLDPSANPPSELYFNPKFLSPAQSEEYFQKLQLGIPWENMKMYTNSGETIVTRLVSWFGPFGYSYSKTHHQPFKGEWPNELLELKDMVEVELAKVGRPTVFNSVLLNLYRDGKDGVSWHTDNEISMGVKPTIASISLGDTRKFELRKKENVDGPAEWRVYLTSGSLIVMDKNVQDDWQHRVPREYHERKPRINLTFRVVHKKTKEGKPLEQQKLEPLF